MPPARRLRAAALVCLTLAAAACEEVEQIQDRFRDMTPHEAYRASLEAAGLAATALGRDWVRAGRAALDEATPVSLPFEEEGFITPETPRAVAYRVTVARGRRLEIDVTVDSPEGTRVFVDVFRVPEDPQDPYRPVLSADTVPGSLALEPWRGGDFVVRVQPELLRGGRYHVTLRLEAQLAFPVEGHTPRSIQSVWGAPRDGGRRSHEGVDIFARRGTPVVATSDGVVRSVRETPIGGKVVWLRDPRRGISLYYAHLDSQAVQRGQQVKQGDTLGFVGNTGNARTTPPHLHFGIYRRGEGATNPDPFIRPPRGSLEPLEADLERLGSWVTLERDGIRLRSGPSRRAEVLAELDDTVPMRVLGSSGSWYRVRLADGTDGFVAARLTRLAEGPPAPSSAPGPGASRSGPAVRAGGDGGAAAGSAAGSASGSGGGAG